MLIYLPLTAISARSSSLVSFVFKSTAMPFASRIVLQQLSTLSLINTRLRSNENAILFLSLLLSLVRSIAEWNFHVYTLCELVVTAAACDWLKRTAITCRNFPAIIWKNIGSFTYSGAILNWKSSESYKKKDRHFAYNWRFKETESLVPSWTFYHCFRRCWTKSKAERS